MYMPRIAQLGIGALFLLIPVAYLAFELRSTEGIELGLTLFWDLLVVGPLVGIGAMFVLGRFKGVGSLRRPGAVLLLVVLTLALGYRLYLSQVIQDRVSL